jgi:hypothetical protein
MTFYFKEIEQYDMEWIELFQDRCNWQGVMSTVVNFRVA